MELNDIFVNVEILRALATLLAAVFAVVGIYVLTLWGVAKGAEYWRAIRGYVPTIIKAFDEQTDPGPALIDNALDKLHEAQWDKMISVFMPEFLERVKVMLDEKLITPPAQEVNLAAADPNPPAFVESRPLSESVK